MINTHFDHIGREARVESAKLIAKTLKDFIHLPTLVTGDLNAGESSKPIRELKKVGLRDTLRTIHPETTDVGTFGGFRGKRGGAKIDYVFAGMRWKVDAAEIVRDNDEGRFPSDHYPVTATLSLPAKTQLMPVLDGHAWHITGMPDLGDLNNARQEIVDHGIFQSNDGKWQAWACIRNTKIGRLLFRWQGESLAQGRWNAIGTAMRASSNHGESIDGWGGKEWIQAPFVILKDDSHHMFYGGHLAENGECQICLATSEDGVTFARRLDKNGHSRLFIGPGEARDPMVLKIGESWHCYYTGHDTGKRAPCKIYCRTSKDLLAWSAPIAVNWGGTAGSGNWSAECPFVVHREGFFYLFRTENYRAPLTHVYRSSDPLDFGKGDDSKRIGSIHVAAPEVVTHAGSSFISSVHDLKGGIQLFRMKWVPQEQAVTSTSFLANFEKLFDFEDGSISRWTIDGEALRSQPTFTESGIVRKQHVTPQGQWFIGTYENRPSPDTPAGRQQGDAPTGSMRSPPFKLPSGRVTFLIGGGQDHEKTYVALHIADTDGELFRATGQRSNLMRRVVWDVSEHADKEAYLRIVDHSSAPWGHVNFDDFRVER